MTSFWTYIAYFHFLTSHITVFTHNLVTHLDRIYLSTLPIIINQIDGVAMGSPLPPFLANIFMGFHKSKWVNEYNLSKPKFYLRYVNDILAAFVNEEDSLNF